MWDTAGQDRFRALIPSYIRDSTAAVVVFDLTSRASFENVKKWVEAVREERGDDVVIAVAGNKVDLTSKRKVTTEEAEKMARELRVGYGEVSAKSGANIRSLFEGVAERLPREEDEEDPAPPPGTARGNATVILRADSVPPAASDACNC